MPLVLTAGFTALIGLLFVVVGLRLWNRRPVVLPPKALVGFLAVAFLPAAVFAGLGVVAAVAEGEYRLLLPIAFPVALAVVLLLFFRRILGRAIVVNVDETLLYDALESSLDRHGLTHHERRSTIEVAERDVTLEVNYQATTHSGTVSLRGDDQKELWPVLADLRGELAGRRLAQRSRLATMYLVLGVLLVASQLSLLALRGIGN